MGRLAIRFCLVIGVAGVLIWLALARPFVFVTGEPHASVRASPHALERDTKRISLEFFPRNWRNVDNLNRLAAFLEAEFKVTNSRVSLQTYPINGVGYHNVISEYGSPSEVGTVVIGAHYDAYGELPGADDNASGVAGLLELGRMLSRNPPPFKVLLVAYTLEEPPFFPSDNMGSAVHAASLVKSGENVRLMISLEMIGYFSDAPKSQSYPIPLLDLFYPSRGNFVAIVGGFSFSRATIDLKRAFLNSVTLPAVSINAPAIIPGIDFSDHRNYWKHGFDAVMITDTAFLRNDAYHTERDTHDRLNYEKMSDVVTGVFSYLSSLE